MEALLATRHFQPEEGPGRVLPRIVRLREGSSLALLLALFTAPRLHPRSYLRTPALSHPSQVRQCGPGSPASPQGNINTVHNISVEISAGYQYSVCCANISNNLEIVGKQ